MTLRRFSGFSLVELITVIAVIGVLTGIALPLYQGYIARTQAVRVMQELGYLRVLVEECLSEGALEVGSELGQCHLGGVSSVLVSSFAPTLDSAPLVTLRAVFGGRVAEPLDGRYLTWSRSARGAWECRSNVSILYLPSGCREE